MNSGSREAKAPSAAPRTPSANGTPPLDRGEPSPGVLVPQPVELAVILAAGEGSRLARHGKGQPKPAVLLLGLSLSERTVLACMDAGIRRFVVVLGHEKERVRSHFERIAVARSC